jgi:hypothetical protein
MTHSYWCWARQTLSDFELRGVPLLVIFKWSESLVPRKAALVPEGRKIVAHPDPVGVGRETDKRGALEGRHMRRQTHV